MIGIYERSLCQSYASAYRAGIKIGEAETREDALKQVEAMTEDSYQCFAVDDDGTCIDLTGTYTVRNRNGEWHGFTCYPREFWKDNKKRAGEVCEKCRDEIDYDQVRRRKAKAGEAS